MSKSTIVEDTITIPRSQYNILKELHKTVKRQQILLRIEEAEKNLRNGKVKKISMDEFLKKI